MDDTLRLLAKNDGTACAFRLDDGRVLIAVSTVLPADLARTFGKSLGHFEANPIPADPAGIAGSERIAAFLDVSPQSPTCRAG
jgi:hypothetical protein